MQVFRYILVINQYFLLFLILCYERLESTADLENTNLTRVKDCQGMVIYYEICGR